MACISEHLHHRPWQVATSPDCTVLYRRWNARGTTWGVTARDVAFQHGVGAFIDVHGDIYQFSGGFVRVNFGS